MVFEDRISKYPGRWTLVREDGSSEVVTLIRNDEPIKDGTPINELSLIAFPTRELFDEKINDFDLIIFDRYQRRSILPSIYMDNIATTDLR